MTGHPNNVHFKSFIHYNNIAFLTAWKKKNDGYFFIYLCAFRQFYRCVYWNNLAILNLTYF